MAKITLPTNYRDDILNSSAEGKRKYVMSYNQDGTVSFEDVTVYDQVGSDFGAGDINTANEAINQSFDKNKLIADLDTINALTEEGYAPDALAVREINESLENILVPQPINLQARIGNIYANGTMSYAYLVGKVLYFQVYITGTNNGTVECGFDIPTQIKHESHSSVGVARNTITGNTTTISSVLILSDNTIRVTLPSGYDELRINGSILVN